MSACLVCLDATPPDTPDGHYHAACLRRLFGCDSPPRIDLDLEHFPARVAPEIGRMSISGAQRKALVRLSNDKSCLLVTPKRSRYILKPQHEHYSHVPENEHASMRIAALAGVIVPPLGLFRLADGSLAYVIKRYDRASGRKLHQEDFCQLLGRPSRERANGTLEECAAIVPKSATEPDVELRRLFRFLVVTYWVGNADLHLKNLSMLRGKDGALRLSPAYDVICTRVYGEKTSLMSLDLKDKDLRRGDWLGFAQRHARIGREEAAAVIDDVQARTDEAIELLRRSPLPVSLRKHYERVLRKRSRALA